MSYAIDHLTTGFVESLNEPLKASVHDKIDEVRYGHCTGFHIHMSK